MWLLLAWTGLTSAQESAPINFYLPVESQAYPKMINGFRRYLNQHDLHEIKIITAEHWHGYQQGIRAGRNGIYFAAPHFAAWASLKHNFKPWLRLSSPISYVIATRQNDGEVFEMNDLANLTVCARKPLNLDYLLINSAFDDSLLSANIKVVPSVVAEMRRASSDCRGFALNNQQYNLLETTFPERYIRVQQSRRFNNYALVVAPRIIDEKADMLSRLADVLGNEAGRRVLEPLLKQYSNQPAWVPASSEDYPREYVQKLLRFW